MGEAGGWGGGARGFLVGLSYGVWGAFPVRKEAGVRPLALLQRTLDGAMTVSPAGPSPPTIELLQAIAVILRQAVLVRVAHRTLVEGPHNGVGG